MKDIFKYCDYVTWLTEILEERNTKNKYYSLRAFARDLDFSVGCLSEVLSGKRIMSLKQANLLCKKLKMKKYEFYYLIELILLKEAACQQEEQLDFIEQYDQTKVMMYNYQNIFVDILNINRKKVPLI